MNLESRWFDCGTGYCVLVMDVDASGLTWEQGQEIIVSGGADALPETVFRAMWGYEENREDAEARATHLEMCKTETERLAVVAFAPRTVAPVTLSP